jgi:RNA polymerase sigma-70 factor (ECF subfamily)
MTDPRRTTTLAKPPDGTPCEMAIPSLAPPSASNLRELILLESAQRGDRLALESLVERHQAAVFGYLRARLLEPADAEDLTQEVFLRTYVGQAPYDRGISVRAWLLGTARNLLREHLRRVRRRKEVAWTELCLQLDELAHEAGDKLDEALDDLPRCLEALGPSARQALDLHYQGRLRLAQIGEKLRRSEGAVKLLMFRARQALRHCLQMRRLERGHAQ